MSFILELYAETLIKKNAWIKFLFLETYFDKIKIPLHMPLLRISHVYAGELISLLEAWWYSLPPIH